MITLLLSARLKLTIGFLLLFLSFSIQSNGQSSPDRRPNGLLQSVSPLSPEASALGKFGDWPVSYYTGTTNISIPIYTIKTKGFELPVQLSYHTGGVKIDEVPTWVGTGWTLNAGGMITRSIFGIADEEYYGFMSKNMRGDTLKNSYDFSDLNDYLFLREVALRQRDTEPDMFFYNFGNMSGKFYFDKAGQFRCIPENSLKLLESPIQNPLQEYWKIADQHGNIFYFSDNSTGIETTTQKTITNGEVQIEVQPPSAWYLTRIVLNNNSDIIYFDYAEKGEIYSAPPVYSYKKMTYQEGNIALLISGHEEKLGINRLLTDGISSGYSTNQVIVGGITRLEKIRWSGGELRLIADINRTDIIGLNLNKVRLFDKQSNLLKETRFSYSYKNQRYFLDSLIEYSSDLIRQSKYGFEYESPENLPQRHSSAQDHWGYFNGATNTHLLPYHAEIGSSALNANREPNEMWAKVGSLKRIIYPTGGVTDFEFEGNRYDGQDVVGGGNPTQELVGAARTVVASDPQTPGTTRTEFFVKEGSNDLASIDLSFKNYGKPPSKHAGILPIVKLEVLSNGVYQHVYTWDAYTDFPTSPVVNQNNLYDFEFTRQITLTNGSYRLTADLLPETFGLGDPPNIMPEVNATIRYQTLAAQGPGGPGPVLSPLAGGLRVKQIINRNNGVIVSKKRFTYVDGKLLLYPKYIHSYGLDVYPMADCHQDPNGCGTLCMTAFVKYREVISTSQAVLGLTQGAAVGYQSIKEEDVTDWGDVNGYTNYSFSFEPDVVNELEFVGGYWTDEQILNRAAPVNSNEYKRGLLLEKDIYKNNSSTGFIRISSLRNIYEFNLGNVSSRYNSMRGMRVKRMRTVNYPCGTTLHPNGFVPATGYEPDFAYSFYTISTSWLQNKSTIETTFDQNGQNPVVKRTDFTYNNAAHLQPTLIQTIGSNGIASDKTLIYPHEMVSLSRDPNGVYQAMINKNIISPVIEEKVIVNGKQDIQFTNYYQPSAGIFVPQSVKTWNLITGQYEDRASFSAFDNQGNILEQSQTGGLKEVYVWGYDKQYVLAKVTGSTSATVSSLLNQTILDTGTEVDRQAQVSGLRSYFASNPNVQVTTFTYKPLVGMTSQTDPKGVTTYYEYDSFQRLKAIKDQNGHVIKSYDYHYKP